ncbi:MAG: Tn7 transposase TnsA N-terminal domain-containing protein [Gammaproteobacteria bacterium]
MDGPERRRYTPDFLIRRPAVTEAALIEVTYEADLHAHSSQLRPAFEAAHRWAQENGATFRVMTECDICGPYLNKAKRLLPLRRAPLDTKMALLAMTAVHALRAPTFGTLLAALPDPPRGLSTLWRLITRGALRVDLSAPIDSDTPIRSQ